ncbi:DUF6510 family protein [Actinacidiphila rubida]|uniref:Uncharacterized protein n=1 Tax=Actinacidiphila rubida TaxID=310780 RepID=A0A1H8KL01_9ACTN|nr:DUF6510 family protein [Actinacidiphila rubida]SEN93660.1 hypothetical protein SAMN05216267_101373 [Actinacidiphila rubida]
MTDDLTHMDGNCLAGPLSEILAVEPTAAWWRCPQCGRSGTLAQLHVYGPEPGMTAVCPGCAYIALRLVKEEDHVWLALGSGTSAVRFRTA